MFPIYDKHTTLIMDIRENLHDVEELVHHINSDPQTQRVILQNLKIANQKLLELSHTHNGLKNTIAGILSPDY